MKSIFKAIAIFLIHIFAIFLMVELSAFIFEVVGFDECLAREIVEYIMIGILPVVITYIIAKQFIPIIKERERKAEVNLKILVPMICISTLIVFVLSESFFTLFDWRIVSSGELDEINPIFEILTAVFIAPIYEEVLCRGIILRFLLSKENKVISVIISSLMFSIMHVDLRNVVSAFLFSVFVSIIYIKYGNLKLCILSHGLTNFYLFFLYFLSYINILGVGFENGLFSFHYLYYIIIAVFLVMTVHITKVKKITIPE